MSEAIVKIRVYFDEELEKDFIEVICLGEHIENYARKFTVINKIIFWDYIYDFELREYHDRFGDKIICQDKEALLNFIIKEFKSCDKDGVTVKTEITREELSEVSNIYRIVKRQGRELKEIKEHIQKKDKEEYIQKKEVSFIKRLFNYFK